MSQKLIIIKAICNKYKKTIKCNILICEILLNFYIYFYKIDINFSSKS